MVGFLCVLEGVVIEEGGEVVCGGGGIHGGGVVVVGRVQGCVGGVVEVVVVLVARVVVLVVVAAVRCAAHVVDVYVQHVVGVGFKPPFVAPVRAVGRVHAQVREGDPVQLDGFEPREPLRTGRVLLDGFEERFQDERTAAEEDAVVLEERLEGFERDLAVEEEVLVVEDEEEGGGAGAEVLQVAALDAEGAVAALVRDAEGMVVDLAGGEYAGQQWVPGYGSLSRCTHLIAQLAWQPQEWQDAGRVSTVFVTCSDINHRCDACSRRSGSHLTSSVQTAASYLILVSTEVFPASRSALRHRHVIGGGAELAGAWR